MAKASPETTLPPSAWPFLVPPQQPGELGRLAQYRVLRQLGRGGMGMVFEAEDRHLRRRVALKVMLPEIAAQDLSRERFLREARAAAALKHDHVVTIYQVGEDRGVPFLAMELLAGKSLGDWLAAGRRPSIHETLLIGRQIAKGLAAAHRAGLIHRDIKPANLWLEAPTGRLKILDFGLARSTDRDVSAMTQEGAVVGTPAFMAPEQARGEAVTHQVDLFSLGCILYRLAAGRAAFAGDTLVAVLSAVLTHRPTPVRELNPEVPPRLATLIERLLEKQPADRPATAQDVLDELLATGREWKATGDTTSQQQAETIPLGEPSSAPSAANVARRRRWLLAAAGLGLAAVLGLAFVGWRSFTGEPATPVNAQPASDETTPSEAAQAAKEPPAPLTEPVDLLNLIKPEKDGRAGNWRFVRGSLSGSSREGRFALVLPWDPPAEYRLRMTVQRIGGDGPLGIGLASGEARFILLIDDEHEGTFRTGIGNIDGKLLSERTDGWTGQVLSPGVPLEVLITVENDRVSLTTSGKSLYRWQGDLSVASRQKMSPPLKQPRSPLVLFSGQPGAFGFDKLILEPLGVDRGQMRKKLK